MAKEYFEKLSALVTALSLHDISDSQLEIKHFFSGAALYCNGQIRGSWSPAGLAFKLPGREAEELIAAGIASSLRYFPKGHVKSGYAVFENPDVNDEKRWREYFLKAIAATDSEDS